MFDNPVYGNAEESRCEDAPLSDPGCGTESARELLTNFNSSVRGIVQGHNEIE